MECNVAYHVLGKVLQVVHVGGAEVVAVVSQPVILFLETEPPVEELSVLEASQENLVLA